MGEYPRKPGSPESVRDNAWNRGAPFGHCPACGSPGFEEAPSVECEEASFRCSDEGCLTVIITEEGTLRGLRGLGEAHTTWSEKKPPEQRAQEARGISWNWEHFSPEVCLAHDLV